MAETTDDALEALAKVVISGSEAADNNRTRDANPHDWGTSEWYAWEAGYDRGKNKDATPTHGKKMGTSPRAIAYRVRNDHELG